jgi:hypothetical protein
MLAEKANEITPDADSVPDMMSPAQASAVFDAAAQRYLRMPGAEFIKKWDCGFFKGKRQLASRVDAVSILLPLIGR